MCGMSQHSYSGPGAVQGEHESPSEPSGGADDLVVQREEVEELGQRE